MGDYNPNIIENDRRLLADLMVGQNEALTYEPYKDSVGKMSIGYGRNLDDRGITYEEAELMKANDIAECDKWLFGQFGFYRKLSEVRKSVLIDMVYNLGKSDFIDFKNMIGALAVSNYKEAANEIENSRYWNQVGPRAKRNWYMMRFNKYVSKSEAESYFENQ